MPPRLLATVLTVALVASALTACSSAGGGQRATPTTADTPSSTTSATSPTSTTARSTPTTARATIAGTNEQIARWAKSREGTTDISIGRLGDGAVVDITPGPQTIVRIASVMKVSIAIAFLRARHDQGRTPSATELVHLGLMIQVSKNHEADLLWDESGASAGLAVTTTAAGMTQTAYQRGHGWGFTLSNAHDQALLATALARGELLSASDTRLLLALMRNVQPGQNWGFADTAEALKPAIKNGWYDDTDVPVWRVHCMAIFDNPTLAHPFSIVVTTRYPSDLGIEYGQETCRGVGRRLGAWLDLV